MEFIIIAIVIIINIIILKFLESHNTDSELIFFSFSVGNMLNQVTKVHIKQSAYLFQGGKVHGFVTTQFCHRIGRNVGSLSQISLAHFFQCQLNPQFFIGNHRSTSQCLFIVITNIIILLIYTFCNIVSQIFAKVYKKFAYKRWRGPWNMV